MASFDDFKTGLNEVSSFLGSSSKQAKLLGYNVWDFSHTYSHKIAANVKPGQVYNMADQSKLRILQVFTSPSGIRMRVANQQGHQKTLTAHEFAAIGPITAAMRRLASFVFLAAIDTKGINALVQNAVTEAGYPNDPTMDWGKYLTKLNWNAITRLGDEAVDSAIKDMVIHELYDNHNLTRVFNPNHTSLKDLSMEQKVRRYLVSLFDGRREWVNNTASGYLGTGVGVPRGNSEQAEAARQRGLGFETGRNDSSDEGENRLSIPDMVESKQRKSLKDIEEFEGNSEVQAFLQGFKSYVQDSQKPKVALLLNKISDLFGQGMNRKQMQEAIFADKTLESELGKSVNKSVFNYALKIWGEQIRQYARNSDAPIARVIRNMVQTEEKKPLVASLKIADMVNPVAPPVGTPGQAPQNPNVTQQQNAAGKNNQQQSTDTDQAMQTMAQSNKTTGTVSPEIPGVNHGQTKTPPPVVNQPAPPVKTSYYRRFAVEEESPMKKKLKN